MTSTYGITHTREQPARKVTVTDPRVAPKLVLYDPTLTARPSAGKLDRLHGYECAGAFASKRCIRLRASPVSTAIAISAVGYITSAHYAVTATGRIWKRVVKCLPEAHLAGLSLAGVSIGAAAWVCAHARRAANVPHGIAKLHHFAHANAVQCRRDRHAITPAVKPWVSR